MPTSTRLTPLQIGRAPNFTFDIKAIPVYTGEARDSRLASEEGSQGPVVKKDAHGLQTRRPDLPDKILRSDDTGGDSVA